MDSESSQWPGARDNVMLVHIEDLRSEDPKASGGNQKTYTSEMKDLCHWAEDLHWSLEVMLMVKIRAPLTRTTAFSSDSKASSTSNENSLVHIRKTIHSKLL